jgi:excisionase family DNA binding protein
VPRPVTAPPSPDEIRALPPTIDVAMAARLLGIGRNTAYRLLDDGDFPGTALRSGNRWRIVTASVLDYLGTIRHQPSIRPDPLPQPPPSLPPGRTESGPRCPWCADLTTGRF